MPTRITADLWNYIPQGSKAQSVATSVIHGFLYDPVLSRLKNWDVVQQYAKITFGNVNELFLAPLVGAVVNLCIDINVLPILYSQVRNLPVGTSAMDFWMFNFIQHFLTPYYMGSPSKAIISLDPRAVSVESFQVPNAKDVANAITYIFSYQTPPLGSPSKTINKTYNKNLTITGNSTQVPTLKMPSSTSHLETNITKRASVTCQDNYPNILSFLQSGPMTTVGTNTISCAV